MIRELKQQHQKKDQEKTSRKVDMEHPADLSLGPSLGSYSSSSESDVAGSVCKKRKMFSWEQEQPLNIEESIELHLKHPLPPDWEQCLDLQSGRMYYMNRRTLKKSWEWPCREKKKIDMELELNISTSPSQNISHERKVGSNVSYELVDYWKKQESNSNMVAVPCLRCHLLVMLCTSSPSCPNCKYVHSLPFLQTNPSSSSSSSSSSLSSSSSSSLSLFQTKITASKSMETLSLLN